jgi:hypothetical protein
VLTLVVIARGLFIALILGNLRVKKTVNRFVVEFFFVAD